MSACHAPRLFLGCDVALRHGALVLVDASRDGDVLHAEALVQGAGDARALAAAGVQVQRVPNAESSASGPQADLLRLLTLRGWLDAALGRVAAFGACEAVLEGVTFHGRASQVAVMGLAGSHALARVALADAGISTRIVQPTAIRDALHGGRLKKGVDGKALNRAVVAARWGYSWPGDGEADLADAYALARLAG